MHTLIPRAPRVALLMSAFLGSFLLGGCGRQSTAPALPVDVMVAACIPKDVPLYDEFVGTLDGSTNASIQARVQGYLVNQDYKEGSFVTTGAPLFRIDPRPFEAVLAQARASLAQAEAAARQADMLAKRQMELFEQNVTSAQEKDNATLQAEAARANVEAQKAAVTQALLNVEYTTIRSPIDGIAGLARMQVGDLVGPGTGPLTSISTVDPIKVIFTVSDQRYVAYLQRWAGNPEGRAAYERQLEYELILANGTLFPRKGHLYAVDNDIDVTTGAQRIAVLFPNPDNGLRRGQFARVRMRSEVRHDAILVPQRAVIELQGSYQIIVVGPDNKAEVRLVRMGRRIGQNWLVEAGLKAGDRVVIEGLQKLKTGTPVNPVPWKSTMQDTQSAVR